MLRWNGFFEQEVTKETEEEGGRNRLEFWGIVAERRRLGSSMTGTIVLHAQCRNGAAPGPAYGAYATTTLKASYSKAQSREAHSG